ncbi:hypothetical protein HPB51_007918 [Rhipicephalus microplus]|uniref:Uncharacterized protein n=1 Tax=Rhipicephalus microplus TaxID=6941 RepID=A0A9J6EMQ7_RHIMP|nr:hypothetical protein HPB51_007918 [Rhipicephalus microplus]
MLHRLDDCVERTSETYKSHLEAFALDPTVNGPIYGIASASPLQTLENFDITEQLPPDAMHDILEGGMECVIRHVLGSLVGDRVIRKQDLERISSFKYGFHDKKATPLAVTIAFLNGKASMRGSASQKWCFFRLLPQIYAEVLPEGNSHWEVYLAYRHIADIILAEKIPRSCVPYLQVKVEEFLELYTVQYPNAAVTPKLHFLLHYPKYILKYGPPRRYWGMRFEAKHSYFKSIASKTKNFKNICLTLATRHQLLQAYELSGNMLNSDLETTRAKQLNLGDLPEQQQLALRKVSEEEFISTATTASVSGYCYRTGDTFVHSVQDGEPQFMQIKRVLVVSGSLVLLCKPLETLQCSEHRSSYIVKPSAALVVIIPDHKQGFYPLDLYSSHGFCEVVTHYAVL